MSNEGLFIQPHNTLPQIDQLWLVVSVDANDANEGVCAAMVNGVMMPLIAADEKRLDQIKTLALAVKRKTGMKLKLIRFSQREEIGEI
jgi:hypothetical protein